MAQSGRTDGCAGRCADRWELLEQYKVNVSVPVTNVIL